MKKILLIVMMVAMTQAALGAQVGIVVKDNTSRSTVGVDTLLGDFIMNVLGKTVDYRDLDSLHTPSAWTGYGYSLIIFVGENVSGGGSGWNAATAAADSVAKTSVPFYCIGNQFYNEINLGQGAVGLGEGTGNIVNIGTSHWITKVFPDTVRIWGVTSANNYSITISDTGQHSVQVLMLDKDAVADTSSALLAVCDAGATITNTGDGRNVSNQRRVFCGLWQYQSVLMDSCHFWTLFARSVAWAIGDTNNANIMGRICFSGPYDFDWCSVAEYEQRTRSYGWYDSNVGKDNYEKHLYCKINNGALQRAIGNIYRAFTVDSAIFALRYKGTGWNNSFVPDSFSTGMAFNPIIRKWQVEKKICYFSNTCPNASWQYAWMDTAGGANITYEWELGGARGATDSRPCNYDTMRITNRSTVGTRYRVKVNPDTLTKTILDTTINWGWASKMTDWYVSATGSGGVHDGNDYGEPAFTATLDGNNRGPRLNIFSHTYSTSIPTPHIVVDCGTYGDDSLVFSGVLGQDLGAKTVQITNSQGGALSCATITDNQSWLATFSSGANMPITVTHGITSQALGYRSATVTITCADADNSPVTYKVVCIFTAASAATSGGTVKIK